MHIHKTKEKGIGIDFIKGKGNKAIIFCQGFPSQSNKNSTLEELSKKGFSVVFPKYYGSYESEKKFSIKNSVKTVKETISLVGKKRLECVFCGKKEYFGKKKIMLIGDSYGTMIAREFKNPKALFSPVYFTKKTEKELKLLEKVFNKGVFGKCYNLDKNFFKELKMKIKKQEKVFEENETVFFDRGKEHGYSKLKNSWLKKN